MSLSPKSVFILVGPKGSGKSYIGKVLEMEFGIPFLNVDLLGLDNIPKSKMTGDDLIIEGFHHEEAKIDEILLACNVVSFETTGSHPYFFTVLERLKKKYSVNLIRVRAPLDKCLERISQRDPTANIPVSADLIFSINERAAKVQLPWDLELDNSENFSNKGTIEAFRRKFPMLNITLSIRSATALDADKLTAIAISSKAYWPYDSSFLELCKEDLTMSPLYCGSGLVFLAEINNEPIGFYGFAINRKVTEMNNLFVSPEYIGQRFGLTLWNHAVEFAKSTGWSFFELDADPYAAEKFYYKVGCIKVGEAESTVQKGRILPRLRFNIK